MSRDPSGPSGLLPLRHPPYLSLPVPGPLYRPEDLVQYERRGPVTADLQTQLTQRHVEVVQVLPSPVPKVLEETLPFPSLPFQYSGGVRDGTTVP